jgi:tellurium resistance protein TerD
MNQEGLKMSVNLQKGQRVDLTKENAGVNNILAGLGWDTNRYLGEKFDLDVSAFLLNENAVAASADDIVFYNNETHGSGSVVYGGDNRDGEGDGDDETVKIELSKVPAKISKIAFAVSIHEADARKQNFGQIDNAYIRIVNDITGIELLHYDLGEEFSIETAVVAAELYRHDGEWKFNAIGMGLQGGLAAICAHYGLDA